MNLLINEIDSDMHTKTNSYYINIINEIVKKIYKFMEDNNCKFIEFDTITYHTPLASSYGIRKISELDSWKEVDYGPKNFEVIYNLNMKSEFEKVRSTRYQTTDKRIRFELLDKNIGYGIYKENYGSDIGHRICILFDPKIYNQMLTLFETRFKQITNDQLLGFKPVSNVKNGELVLVHVDKFQIIKFKEK